MKKLLFKMKKVAFAASLLCVSAGVFGMENQNTEWFEAAKSGNLSQLSQIIERGMDLNVKDEGGNTALMLAAREADCEVVDCLIRSDYCLAVLDLLLEWKRSNHLLSEQFVRQWKNNRESNVNEMDKRGSTALIHAAYHWERRKKELRATSEKQKRTVKLLIDAGAEVNARDLDWRDPLRGAVYGCQKEVVRLLVEAGAGVGVCEMLYAVEEGHTDIVKSLINAGFNVNAKVNRRRGRKRTLLMAAASKGYEGVVKLLIDAGADVNVADEYGRTPLMMAACRQHGNVVKLLIDAGADVNATSDRGTTALGLANDTRTVKLLRSVGKRSEETRSWSDWW